MKKKSFSLIELLVVLSIFSIILVLFISKFSFLNKFLLKNEIEKLYSDFYFLQQKAISKNEKQELFLELNNNLYFYNVLDKKVIRKFSNFIEFGFLKSVKGPPSCPRKYINKAVTFKKYDSFYKVEFFNNGIVSAGTIYLIDKNKKYMNALTVGVSNVFYIRKYKFVNSHWLEII